MQLNQSNYHSKEADKHYMSVSQFKRFMECESRELAILSGDYEEKKSNALLVGSYVHSAFESDEAFEQLVAENHDSIFKSRGGKYAEYIQADLMIDTLKRDRMVQRFYVGEKEQIFTGNLFGVEWKAKVDCIDHDNKRLFDLKTTKSLYDRYWSERDNRYVSFVERYGYVLQMAVYREIIYQNTGHYYEPFIIAVTKESPPDKALLHFDNDRFQFELDYVESMLPGVMRTKNGQAKHLIRCERCDYCRATKQLNKSYEIATLLD